MPSTWSWSSSRILIVINYSPSDRGQCQEGTPTGVSQGAALPLSLHTYISPAKPLLSSLSSPERSPGQSWGSRIVPPFSQGGAMSQYLREKPANKMLLHSRFPAQNNVVILT